MQEVTVKNVGPRVKFRGTYIESGATRVIDLDDGADLAAYTLHQRQLIILAGSENGGSLPATNGMMGGFLGQIDNVDQSYGTFYSGLEFAAIYDTDGYADTPTANEAVIPAGLGGMYQIEVTVYNADDGQDAATFILNDPSNSGDFLVGPSDIQPFVGGISFVRPLQDGDTVQLNTGGIRGGSFITIMGSIATSGTAYGLVNLFAGSFVVHANDEGAGGNAIEVVIQATIANQPLSVAVSGTTITVELAKTAGSVTSTVQEIADAITNDLDAADLVSVDAVLGGGNVVDTSVPPVSRNLQDGGVVSADTDPSLSVFTLTRLGPLPDGWTGYP